MKRLFLVVVFGLVLAVSGIQGFVSHVAPTLLAQEDPAKITGYITKTGEKVPSRRLPLLVSQQDRHDRDCCGRPPATEADDWQLREAVEQGLPTQWASSRG